MNTTHPTRPAGRVATSILALGLLVAPGVARAENEGGTGRATSIAGPIADWLLGLTGLGSLFSDNDLQTAEPGAGNGTGGQASPADPEASGGSGDPTREGDGQGTGSNDGGNVGRLK